MKAPSVRAVKIEDADLITSIDVSTRQVAFRGIVPETALSRFSRENREPVWKDRLARQDQLTRAWLLEDLDTPVGYVYAGPSRDDDVESKQVGEIYDLYVLPDNWGKGGGRRLLEVALKHFRATKFSVVTLWVMERNARARGFYVRQGFEPDGVTKITKSGVPELRHHLSLN